jgi:hypothetical protein
VLRKIVAFGEKLFRLRANSAFGFSVPASDFVKNEEVRREMRRHGDDCKAERPIQHYAYFPEVTARRRYREFLLGRGYDIVRQEHVEFEPNSLSIVFSKLQAPNDIDHETAALGAYANTCSGEYDGWEADVCRAK